jgi:hypothetical protein
MMKFHDDDGMRLSVFILFGAFLLACNMISTCMGF